MRATASLLIVFALMAVACAGGEEATESAADTAAVETPAEETAAPEVSQEIILATLKAADLADGTEDKVVSRCSGCALAMPGNAEHAIQHEGYELHFCGEDCQHRFSENTDQALAALKVPEIETATE